MASILGCQGHFLPGGGQILEKPRHPVQPPVLNRVQAVVTSLEGSGEPATPPLSGAESRLPPATGKIPGDPPAGVSRGRSRAGRAG